MTNKVTIKSTKEPVRLRVKNLANGVQSLYLDCYVDGKRSYEFLKLYLIPEKEPWQRLKTKPLYRLPTP